MEVWHYVIIVPLAQGISSTYAQMEATNSTDTQVLLENGSNSGITSGQNTIAVVANGGTFTLYLNNTQLGNSITDNTDT